jgi:hypothetical protein
MRLDLNADASAPAVVEILQENAALRESVFRIAQIGTAHLTACVDMPARMFFPAHQTIRVALHMQVVLIAKIGAECGSEGPHNRVGEYAFPRGVDA